MFCSTTKDERKTRQSSTKLFDLIEKVKLIEYSIDEFLCSSFLLLDKTGNCENEFDLNDRLLFLFLFVCCSSSFGFQLKSIRILLKFLFSTIIKEKSRNKEKRLDEIIQLIAEENRQKMFSSLTVTITILFSINFIVAEEQRSLEQVK